MNINRCLVCGQPLDPEAEFNEKFDNPDLCELCNEVAPAGRPR